MNGNFSVAVDDDFGVRIEVPGRVKDGVEIVGETPEGGGISGGGGFGKEDIGGSGGGCGGDAADAAAVADVVGIGEGRPRIHRGKSGAQFRGRRNRT